MRILVIDDDANIREIIRYYLDKTGHQVSEAESPRAARRYFNQELAFELLLMDTHFIEGPSWPFLAELKERYPRLPIVMMTAMPTDEWCVLCDQHGADGKLTGLSSDELYATLRLSRDLKQ
ncbi:MAG: response regulator [Anaerolineae bacterium]|jgi:two-component system OmpR family response regulator|nr:response regulator [Anaerolineae bacterium]